MHWHGLPPSTLLPIAGGAALALGALYWLRLRRARVVVPFSKLWDEAIGDSEAVRLFSKLRRILSLVLQLVLVMLLVLALGDPRDYGEAGEGRHVVVLIDASASMKAIDLRTSEEPGLTRLAQAKREVAKLVRGLGPADRMLIAQMDTTASPLSTLTGDAAELERAIEAAEAMDVRADLERALAFAGDILRGRPRPEVIVVSDGRIEVDEGPTKPMPYTLSFVPIGKSGRNVAMTALSVRRYPLDRDRYEVMLEVYNGGDEAEDVELQLFGDGLIVDTDLLRIEPRARVSRFYPNLAGAKASLEARVRLASGEDDDLPADDRAHALLPEVKQARVLCVTEGHTYLEAALLLASYLDVSFARPNDYAKTSGAFDITIFDGVAPPLVGDPGQLFYLNPSGPSAPVGVSEKPLLQVGFDKVDKKSPLLRWTGIEDAFIGEARRLIPRAGDRIIGESVMGPLLITGTREGRRFIALGFDPRESDVVLRPAWPLFVLNALNELISDDSEYRSGVATGEVAHVKVPANVEEVTLESPSGEARVLPVEEGTVAVLTKEIGVHTLKAKADGGGFELRLAANLMDAEESTIEPAPSLRVFGEEASEAEGFEEKSRRSYWAYFLLAAVALTCLEWMSFHRRLTV